MFSSSSCFLQQGISMTLSIGTGSPDTLCGVSVFQAVSTIRRHSLTLQNFSQENACPKTAAACQNPVRCQATIVAMCCENVQVQLVKMHAHIASPVVDGYGVVMPVQPMDERLDGRLIEMA